jgi:dUTP pyrophosphatase
MNLLNLQIKVVNDMDNIHRDRYINHTHYHVGDSGIDLFCPDRIIVEAGETKFIDLKIQCQMLKYIHPHDNNGMPVSYYLYMRSSATRTPLRLANSVGIIDSGYRGNIIACVDNIKDIDYTIEAGTRLFQICSGDLSPMTMEVVNSLPETSRGTGGFGSTNNIEPEPESDNYIHSHGHYHGHGQNNNNYENGHGHGHGHGPNGECL